MRKILWQKNDVRRRYYGIIYDHNTQYLHRFSGELLTGRHLTLTYPEAIRLLSAGSGQKVWSRETEGRRILKEFETFVEQRRVDFHTVKLFDVEEK